MISSYSRFSVDLDDKEAGNFLVAFKQVLYFAFFAHAPQFRGLPLHILWLGLG